MIALVDNDAISKLAACDLVEPAIAALKFENDRVFMAPSAPYSLNVLKNQEKGRRRYGVEVHARICQFVQQIRTATEVPDPQDMQILLGVEGIDPGEALLFALSARNLDSVIVTGDKRAIRALATAPGLDEIRLALRGRILCWEQILAATIQHLGFEKALDPILAACDADKVLGIAFASGAKTTEASVFDALRSYVGDLRRNAAGLLHPTDV